MWRRERPVAAPLLSAADALALVRAGHRAELVVALVPAGRERRRFEQGVRR